MDFSGKQTSRLARATRSGFWAILFTSLASALAMGSLNQAGIKPNITSPPIPSQVGQSLGCKSSTLKRRSKYLGFLDKSLNLKLAKIYTNQIQ
jgi:hypothetical protein